MRDEFEKARDEANPLPDQYTKGLKGSQWKHGADWAYKWCSDNVKSHVELNSKLLKSCSKQQAIIDRLKMWLKEIEQSGSRTHEAEFKATIALAEVKEMEK